jgi:hypothetical protein
MRYLLFCLIFWTGLSPAAAAVPAVPVSYQPTATASIRRPAGFMDYVIGNRARMIQVTTIGFALGLVILMTSTRKH